MKCAFKASTAKRVTANSLSRVMRFGRFWFGRFFRWFSIRLEPFGVEYTGLIDALVRMRPEEIALRLQKV